MDDSTILTTRIARLQIAQEFHKTNLRRPS